MRPSDKMCNFYTCGPTSCVLAAGWGVGAHSGSSHILTRCLSPPALNQRLRDFCCPFSTIDVTEWKWSAQLEAAWRQHFPQVSYVWAPPSAAFFLNTIIRDFLRFCYSATIFRPLLFNEVIKELPQRCSSEQTVERSVLEQTLSHHELGLINFPSIALPPLFLRARGGQRSPCGFNPKTVPWLLKGGKREFGSDSPGGKAED